MAASAQLPTPHMSISVAAGARRVTFDRYLELMEIRLLGPLDVLVDGAPVALGGQRERALLALLALSPQQPVSTDSLIEALWGEDLPGKPSNALQAVVSRLRRAVGSEAIVTRQPGYMLDVAPEAIDAARFRAMVGTANSIVSPHDRSRLLTEALALWRAPALADFSFEEFAVREAASLEELRLAAVESRIVADLEAGGGGELVPELEGLIAAHPLRESLRASQMLALYRAGRQAEALRAFTAARELLAEELGIDPGPELRALEEAILMQDPSLDGTSNRPVPERRPALPGRLASFVGRASEMKEIADAFAESRLVTLTGAGGSGKTSLAIEVGRATEGDYRDGVWLVELAATTDPLRVADALVAALDLEHIEGGAAAEAKSPMATVIEYLRSRCGLIVFDNCEHVVDAAAAAIEAVLLACPDIDVLATSRDRLGIPGEVLWRVPSLGLSSNGGPSEAATLFLDRAGAVNNAFNPSSEDLAEIDQICRKVDGIPLAIELAAARTRSLSVAEIARRLDVGIGVLSGGPRGAADRQQALRATIDWSFRLLEPDERDLFAALSAFRGTFSLEAVEAIAFAAEPVLEHLERLIDSSVVMPDPTRTENRYRLLEPLRIYAAEALADAGNYDGVMSRLLDYFMDVMAGLETGLRGPDQLEWLALVESDLDTTRALLEWGRTEAPQRALRLAGMLGWYWYLRGSAAEARGTLGALLAAAGRDADAQNRGDATFFHALHDLNREGSLAGFAVALEAYREASHTIGIAGATAMISAFGPDWAEAMAGLDEAAEMYREAGSEWGVALVRFLQAGVSLSGNSIAAAERLAEEAAEGFASLGDGWGEGYSLYMAGNALRAIGDYDGAERALRAALERARPLRLRSEMAPVLAELASIATMRSDFQTAARLLREARVLADEAPLAGSKGMVRNASGRVARLTGDLDAARKLHREALDLYQREGNRAGLAYSHSCLGFTLEMSGDHAGAAQEHLAALDNALKTNDQFALALALEGIGTALVFSGRADEGVELIGAGLATRERAGTPLASGERYDIDRALDSARDRLDASAADSAMARGREHSIDSATELATRMARR